MATVHPEVEVKYDADVDLEVPDPVGLLGAALGEHEARVGDGPWAADDGAQHDLVATYFDTPDLRLVAAGLTLRRRTGGDDAGWHLKVPMPDGSRSEVRLPLEEGDGVVPERLRAMTHARTAGHELVPVVRLETHRTARRLVDATGRVLLEVADDRVTARRLAAAVGRATDHATDHATDDDATGDGATGDGAGGDGAAGDGIASTWREIEVEVVDGPRDLLAAVDPVLRAHGLRPAGTASKLARALGAEAVERARAARAAGAPGAPAAAGQASAGRASAGKASAADVVLAHVAAQVERIRAQDLPVRLDAPGSVHAMRVATRRLRSALTTFGPLLRRPVTRPVAGELKWLAGVLGDVRDAEVMRERVAAAVGAEAQEAAAQTAVSDDVRGRLDDAYRTAREALLGHLDGERYRELLGALEELLGHPPVKKRAGRPAVRVLPELVATGDDEVRSTMRAAHRATDPDERETLLHDARKAAKRARYAAESVSGVLGKDARRYARAMEGVQEAVGEHLDSMNTRARLRDLADQTTLPEAAFTLGRLHAQEDVRVERSRADVDGVWAAARRKRLRRWLR